MCVAWCRARMSGRSECSGTHWDNVNDVLRHQQNNATRQIVQRFSRSSTTRPRRWSAAQRKNTEKNCAAAMRQAIVEQFGELVSPLPHREPPPQLEGAMQRAIEKIPPQPAQAAAPPPATTVLVILLPFPV